jgi:hypothetical protein
MDTRLKNVPQDRKTANCVKCSRSIEHNVCIVLHLLDTGWVIEQTPRDGNNKDDDDDEVRETDGGLGVRPKSRYLDPKRP